MQQRKLEALLITMLFLLALGLRLYRLDAQSLWNDEGTSVALARRSLATITRDASHDIHPPFYYYLLHFWVAALGDSEFAVRSLSALCGAMLVVVIYALGRRLASPLVALLASFFALLSPLQVYYSQETRMYILVTLLGALSFWLFLRWQDPPAGLEPTGGFWYVIVTTLAMYTHYFAFTLLVSQNILFAWRWAANIPVNLAAKQPKEASGKSVLGARLSCLAGAFHAPRSLIAWIASQAIIAFLFLPWLAVVWNQLRAWPAVSEPFGLLPLLSRTLSAFSVGLSMENPLPIAIGFGLIILIGWGIGARPSRSAGVMWAYLLLPVAIIYLLSRQRPMYNPKFLLLATPAFALLLAEGVSLPLALFRQGRGRWLSAAWLVSTTAFVALVSLVSLRSYYFDARYARDDYRGIARYIEAVEGSADAVLINAPGQYETFTYYYRGRSPLYPLPRQRPLDRPITERDLVEMIEGQEHIYAILWATDESDPERFIEGWLDAHAYKAADTWHGNVRLAVYAVPQKAALQMGQRRLEANLGEQVTLEGYTLLTPQPTAGEILQITLFWRARARLEKRYVVFLHVLDAHGHIVGQRDAEPGGGAQITPTWEIDQQVVDNYGVLILPATPPGNYQIVVGMYELDSGERLPVIAADGTVSDRVLLEPITIRKAAQPPSQAVLHMQQEAEIPAGPLTLVGSSIAKLGQEHLPDAPIHGGDVLHLTLFWQATEKPTADVELLIQLLDRAGIVHLARRSAPVEGGYPLTRWEVGEIVRDQHNLFLPGNLAPGVYRLLLSVYESPSGRELLPPTLLRKVTIR